MYYRNIDEFDTPRSDRGNFWISLVFIVLFVFFAYGLLFVGLADLANMLIHVWHLNWFLQQGKLGIAWMVVVLLGSWLALFLLPAALIRWRLRRKGRVRLASLLSTIFLFIGFNIFMLPWVLWPVLRRSSPHLRRRHRQKMKRMLQDAEFMDLRRQERVYLASKRA